MRLYDLATIKVLVTRDLKRFFRQKSRIAGALMQPIIFWGVLGLGLSSNFRMAGNGPTPAGAAAVGMSPVISSVSYAQYFYPGIIAMMVLFTALFSTMSVIEDRASGFLQAVLTAPSSRLAMVIGKVLGGVSVTLVQVSLFLVLVPLAGFSFMAIAWHKLYLMLFLTAFSLNALGFFLAWWLNSIQGYHAIMSVVLIPLWLISGAMFPIKGTTPFLNVLMMINPMTYSVEGIRSAFYAGPLPQQMGLRFGSFGIEVLVVAGFAALFTYLAARRCRLAQAV